MMKTRRTKKQILELKKLLTLEFFEEELNTKNKTFRQLSRELKVENSFLGELAKAIGFNKRYRTTQKYFCKQCHINEINFNTALYGDGKCPSCNHTAKRESYCIDCGKLLTHHHSKRCYICAAKLKSGPNHPMWKGGVTKQIIIEISGLNTITQ